MKLAVPAEQSEHEPRVAAVPESVKKLIALGFCVTIEPGAGSGAHIRDQDFTATGARLESDRAKLLGEADLVLSVRRLEVEDVKAMRAGAIAVSIMDPWQDRAGIEAFAAQKVTAFAMEFMPRISRAQSMDVLSSQSNLAGYKAVIDAAAYYGRAMPMMMTAAGTIAPARVLVMGAGVAGLQAVATARRLGAIVSATDVRPAAKEQVESLGGTFVAVEDEEFKEAETTGGYAKEMSDEYKAKQAELIAKTIKKQDIVICTALIPGRPAPTLISREMVDTMKPGSIIVDLAVEQGGNCAVSKAGEVVVHNDVSIMGYKNVPGRLASDASAFYARNLVNFITLMVDEEAGGLTIDWQDEIIQGTALTRDGAVIHPALQEES